MWGLPSAASSWPPGHSWNVTAYADREGIRWQHHVQPDGAQFWERATLGTHTVHLPRTYITHEELDRQRGPLTAVGVDDIPAVLRAINRLTHERDVARRDLERARKENGWLLVHAPDQLRKAYYEETGDHA